jgi:hypothetical protein
MSALRYLFPGRVITARREPEPGDLRLRDGIRLVASVLVVVLALALLVTATAVVLLASTAILWSGGD